MIITKITKHVKIEGVAPIMFDRYAGDKKTKLPPEEKMYFLAGTQELCIPAKNIKSMFSSQNSTSVAKLLGGKAFKTLADAFKSFISIEPEYIPICRTGNHIEFTGFIDGRDEHADIYLRYDVARLKGGVPNEKERPVLNLPWEMKFNIIFFKNEEFDEDFLKSALDLGGLQLGLGTYRGEFGKFIIIEWT